MLKSLCKKNSYRIAFLANLREDSDHGLQLISRKLVKGLVRNGHDVQVFSYLLQMSALSFLPSKKWTKRFFEGKTNELCRKVLAAYRPDILIFPGYRHIPLSTIKVLREALPNTFFAGLYYDPLRDIEADFIEINKHLHAFMATGAGEPLAEVARKSGNIPAAFMPNCCDPDIEKPYPDSPMPETELLFTGKLYHKECANDGFRQGLLKLLTDEYGLMNYGNGKNPSIWGMDYYGAISKTKIALSINIDNSIPMYHSDRLINCLGCGAFTLASWVPETERLCEDKKHLRYFTNDQECIELVKYYLKNERERKSIAAAGMEHAQQNLNCQRIAKDMIDFLATGTYDAPWRNVYNV